MNLDHIASILCFWCCLCAATLHTLSSPKRQTWMTVPPYLRGGFAVMCAMFLWRGANFWTNHSVDLGHVNPEAVMATMALSYTMGAMTLWVATRTLQDHSWARLDWAFRVMRRKPSLVPVMTDADDVAAALRDRGVRAVGPGALPEDLPS